MKTYVVKQLMDGHEYPVKIGTFTASNEELAQVINAELDAHGYIISEQPENKQ